MSKYYQLEITVEIKDIGAYPQLKLKDYSKEKILHSITSEKLLDSSIVFDFFKFDPDAKKTDFLTCSHIRQAKGLIISSKVKRILEELVAQGGKFTPYQFFPIITDGLGDKEYYYFELKDDYKSINFDECTFEDIINDDQIVKIKSMDDYGPSLLPKKIKLKSDYDFFMIPFDTKIFISERVKKIFEDESIGGYEQLNEYEEYLLV